MVKMVNIVKSNEKLKEQARDFLDDLVKNKEIKKETWSQILEILEKKGDMMNTEVYTNEIQWILTNNWENYTIANILDKYTSYLKEANKNTSILFTSSWKNEYENSDLMKLYNMFLDDIDKINWFFKKDFPEKKEFSQLIDIVSKCLGKYKSFFYPRLVSKEINQEKTDFHVLLSYLDFDIYSYELLKGKWIDKHNLQEILERARDHINTTLNDFFWIHENIEDLQQREENIKKKHVPLKLIEDKNILWKVRDKINKVIWVAKSILKWTITIAMAPIKILTELFSFLLVLSLFSFGLPSLAFKRQKKQYHKQVPGLGISFLDKMMIKFFGKNIFKEKIVSRGNVDNIGNWWMIQKIGQVNYDRFNIEKDEATQSKEWWEKLIEYQFPDASMIEICKLKWYTIYTLDMNKFWSLKKWESLPLPMPYTEENIEFIPIQVDYSSCKINYDTMKNLYVESKWLTSGPINISFLVYNPEKNDPMVEEIKTNNMNYFYKVPEPDPFIFSQRYDLGKEIEDKMNELITEPNIQERVNKLRVFLNDFFHYPSGSNIDTLTVLLSKWTNRIEKTIHAKCGNCSDINSLWYILLWRLWIPCLLSHGYSMMYGKGTEHNRERIENPTIRTWWTIESTCKWGKTLPVWHAWVIYYDREHKKWGTIDFTPPTKKDKKEKKYEEIRKKEIEEIENARDKKIDDIILHYWLKSEEEYVNLHETLDKIKNDVRDIYGYESLRLNSNGEISIDGFRYYTDYEPLLRENIINNWWSNEKKKEYTSYKIGVISNNKKLQYSDRYEEITYLIKHETVLIEYCKKINRHYDRIYPLLISYYTNIRDNIKMVSSLLERNALIYLQKLSSKERMFLLEFLQEVSMVHNSDKISPDLHPIVWKMWRKVQLAWRIPNSSGKPIPIKWFKIDCDPQQMLKPLLRLIYSSLKMPPNIEISRYDIKRDTYHIEVEDKKYVIQSTVSMESFLNKIIMTRNKEKIESKIGKINNILYKYTENSSSKNADTSEIDVCDNFITHMIVDIVEQVVDNPENKKVHLRSLTEKEKNWHDIVSRWGIPFISKRKNPEIGNKIKNISSDVYNQILWELHNEWFVEEVDYFDLEKLVTQQEIWTEKDIGQNEDNKW